jgi:hypothetical protein
LAKESYLVEWKLQGDYPSTYEFHKLRGRANHLSEFDHAPRMKATARLIWDLSPESVSDLGCGDGGLLHLLKGIPSWGYDFTPANSLGWGERGVEGYSADVFNDKYVPRWGELVVMTEVLEHLKDPHGILEWVSQNCRYLLASSPWGETPTSHDNDCHIWAWDFQGYKDLISKHFKILHHSKVDWSQLILARSRYDQET